MSTHRRHGAFWGPRAQRGQMLVEFAIVSTVLYLLFAAIVSFGRLLHSAQVAQQTVDFTTRELARTPLPPEATFEQVRDDPEGLFRQRVFSEDHLVLDITPWVQSRDGRSLLRFLDEDLAIPAANRLLVPVMTVREREGRTLLAYPGALVTSQTAPSGLTVEVPLVVERAEDGTETIAWVRVLEEIDTEDDPEDNTGPRPDPFALTAESDLRGVAALRLALPFQSALLSASETGRAGDRFRARDDAVQQINTPQLGTPVGDEAEAGPNAGPYGLGRQLAFGEEVRPFRRVLTAQSIARREVYE